MMQGSNPLQLKEYNLRVVRQALKSLRAATRQQVAAAAGLSTVTVATLLRSLVEGSEALVGDMVPSKGGRPSVQYHFNAEHSLVLVLFTRETEGQDTLYYRAADLYGSIIDAGELAMTPDSLQAFEPLIDRMLDLHPNIKALGFCLPGIEIDGRVVTTDYPALAGTDIIPHFRKKYGLPALFENDVNAAAVGFAQGHPLAPLDTIAYLYFPRKYPPGSGLLIEGKLFRGKAHYAGEVSLLPLGIDWSDPGLYSSPEDSIQAVARVIASLSSVLNPHRVVLQAEFLSDGQLRGILERCERLLPEAVRPELVSSTDFTGDLQAGIVSLTLDLLSANDYANLPY
jgi:predicted NBD/HSP70 family sugar kinase